MSHWYNSWLPGIPSINIPLPSSIQRRFLSFLLKKSLGHLVKPGQLDVHQIDSQIGLGYVQVKDIELDDQAINALLIGLPVELASGSISSVTVRIPWPNPLTSTLGFSLDSLHLIFHLLPTPKPAPATNLADSVASVAESFLHHELTPREEATLRESLQADFSSSVYDDEAHHTVPGSMDPFLHAPEDEEFKHDIDPAGVSIFATLVERLMARFQFDAVDTKITLVHPDHASFTVSIPTINYGTETRQPDSGSSPSSSAGGETRTLAITGLNISTRDLRVVPSSPVDSLHDSQTASPASSSSSLDENAQSMMTQSLAFLPPRPSSPASSVASSLYESAISTASCSAHGDDSPGRGESSSRTPSPPTQRGGNAMLAPVDEMILSFGAEPILIQLTTPSVTSPAGFSDKLHLSLTTGVVACALRPFHIRSILDILDTWGSHHSPSPSTSGPIDESSRPSWSLELELSVSIRGLMLLFLPAVEDALSDARFFLHPLVPPQLASGYARLHLDNISANITSSQNETPPSVRLDVSLSELSLFSFRPLPSHPEMAASPILITDPHLPSRYPMPPADISQSATQLPVFDSVDWTDDKYRDTGYKLSLWRTSASHARKGSSEHLKADPEPATSFSAIHITGGFEELQIAVAPLHLFVDMSQLLSSDGVLAYVSQVMEHPSILDHIDTSQSDTSDTDSQINDLPVHRRNRRDEDSRRLDESTLKDLGLDLDYGLPPRVADTPKASRRAPKHRVLKTKALNVIVTLPVIRIEVRVPPPPDSLRRSGALVLDLHQIRFQSPPPPPSNSRPTARFSPEINSAATSPPSDDTMLITSCQQIIVALTSVDTARATGFVSLGPLGLTDSPDLSSLPPRLTVGEYTSSNDKTTMVIAVDLPSVNVVLSKSLVDGVQYWADDLSQLLERLSKANSIDSDTERGDSRDASLIGSRFFVNSRPSDSDSSNNNGTTKGETVLKLSVSEAFVRLLLPRDPNASDVARPFEIAASDVDALVEMKPQGKDETVVTLTVMTLGIKDHAPSGQPIRFLSLTAPRGLSSATNPMLKLRFVSLIVPQTTSKESRIKLTLSDFTYNVHCDFAWITSLARFVKAPPGAFESVIPSECTRVSVKVSHGSVRVYAPVHSGALVLYMGDLVFSTEIVGDSPDSSFELELASFSLLALDDASNISASTRTLAPGVLHWKGLGYALMADVTNMFMSVQSCTLKTLPDIRVSIRRVGLRVHLCADTIAAVMAFAADIQAAFKPPIENRPPRKKREPAMLSKQPAVPVNMMASVDNLAFKQVPQVGPAPDMIFDDLPTNLDYLDESFGTAAGLRELRDDDLDEFDDEETASTTVAGTPPQPGIVSKVGGETIRMLRPEGIHIIENYFDNLPPESTDSEFGETTLRVRVQNADIGLFLYEGYDWARTRKTIEDEVKDMRRKLTKIRQLVASGQTQDPSIEDPSKLLFNSFYVGLEQDLDEFEPEALLAAIDDELKEDVETASQSSWQSLRSPSSSKPRVKSMKVNGKRLTRSKGPSIEIRLLGVEAEVDQYSPNEPTVSRTLATVKDLEILDHIKTSTWKKFLTELRSDSRGNVRETDSNMVRVELKSVHPDQGHSSEEARLRAKILPLRLYVDQDALDFLKKFFSFKDPHAPPSTAEPDSEDIYFQLAEIFPVDLKLDYKPRRVDYRALRDGQTIALMNFFHFDGAEMTLRHITLNGITGWPRVFDMLNDLWTPDVKATQLVDVISGVAPIRSVVNVGSGVADLVLLPIAQYKKDGRIVRGVQKGTKAFVKSTATEAIKLGARLATGTQVILEHAEGVLGGQFDDGTITAEALQSLPVIDEEFLRAHSSDSEEDADLISKYADQPLDVKEGVQSAYKSLRKNFNSAAQTILAVPMEVYERSSDEGPVRAVIRAVPIAILKPMIGASEAVSKTLLGLHNTLDPSLRQENEAKYKQR